MPLDLCLIVAAIVLAYIAIAGFLINKWDREEMEQKQLEMTGNTVEIAGNHRKNV